MLHPSKIIITKPEDQAIHLADQIKQLGCIPIIFPTIKIIDIIDHLTLKNKLQNINQTDIIIFVSPTAVQKTFSLLKLISLQFPKNISILAVGSGTATALKKFSINNVQHPQEIFGSEGVLELPLLQNIKNKKIIIFKGESGRELLAKTLIQRGAVVEEIATYKRTLPTIAPTYYLSQWQKTGIDLIICTSESSIQNLMTLLGNAGQPWLLQQLLLVSSPRLVHIIASLGFIKPPLLAKNASDEALLSTLKLWRGQQHG